jgi:hypothetical protein
VSAWKDAERWFCRMLGTRRRGQVVESGWAAGSDCSSGPWSIEIKHPQRAQLPKRWLDQVKRQSKADRKPWVLINAVQGQPRMDAPATIRFEHFLELAADAGWLPDPEGFRRWQRLKHELGPVAADISNEEQIGDVINTLEERGV